MALTAQQLLKTEGVLTAAPDASLASALAQMSSSHDAVFVVQKTDLLGVISPYHVLYRAHFPPATKLKNCLFLAPKLKPETRIEQIARLMLEAKVYFLPVVTAGGKWLGVVSYRRLLRNLRGLKIKPKSLTLAKDTATLGQARNLMKKSGHAHLIIVNNSGRLNGILSRFDLKQSLQLPPGSPVRRFIKRAVATFKSSDNPDAVVNRMLDLRIGSVVMVNNNYQPIGLLSVRDCLEAIARPTPPQLLPQIQLRIAKVRSGFEAFARSGSLVTHVISRFKRQAIHDSLKKLKQRLRKK